MTTVLALAALTWAGCQAPGRDATPRSGIAGVVLLGPRCPVERAGVPCPDLRPAGVRVVIADSGPGDPGSQARLGDSVAVVVTDRAGRFRVAVPPGTYAVTARAGMSCQVASTVVTPEAFAAVAVRCDTGIR